MVDKLDKNINQGGDIATSAVVTELHLHFTIHKPYSGVIPNTVNKQIKSQC